MSIKKKYNLEVDGSLGITGEYTFPIADGSDGQVLTTDGLGAITFETPSAGGSGAFSSNGTVITEAGAEYDVDFVVGAPQLDNDGIFSHDSRMFFDKGLSAFRSGLTGGIGGDAWDNANIGQYSHAVGYNTKASGSYSNAEGASTEASGAIAHAEGGGTIASGDSSHAQGDNTIASGEFSHSEGYFSNSYLMAMNSQACNRFSTAGDAQNSKVQVMRETTDNTTTELTIKGGIPSSSTRLILPARRTWGFKILVSARQESVGASHIFKAEGGIKRDGANNTALIGTPTVSTIVNDAAASAWTVAVSADDTNESLKIEVTGETAKIIHWSAKVELVEVG